MARIHKINSVAALTPEERKFLNDYRSCSPEIQNVIQVAISCGMATQETKVPEPSQTWKLIFFQDWLDCHKK